MLNVNHHFLQVGLGSMGKRRIRNLLFHGVLPEQIIGFDFSSDRCQEAQEKYGVTSFTSFTEAEAVANPDVVIISTPPNLHHEYFLDAAKKKRHFFVEVTTSDAGYDELKPLLDDSFVAAPSCTFRYFPAIKKIKELVTSGAVGKILSFHYHLGQYLPDWHPWEDYRGVYFAQKETGACREMYGYELIWLTDLLGSTVKNIAGFTGKLSDLDMTADDSYLSVVGFKNGIVGTLSIDVVARAPFRTLRLLGTEGVLDWEWQNYTIRVYSATTKEWVTYNLKPGEQEKNYVTTEDMYQEEMLHFLDAIDGKKKYPYTFEQDYEILKTLYALERSSTTGKVVIL
jgi:predicted dehydrogenase